MLMSELEHLIFYKYLSWHYSPWFQQCQDKYLCSFFKRLSLWFLLHSFIPIFTSSIMNSPLPRLAARLSFQITLVIIISNYSLTVSKLFFQLIINRTICFQYGFTKSINFFFNFFIQQSSPFSLVLIEHNHPS